MYTQVYYKVQFCTVLTDWIDIPKVFFKFPDAENLALDVYNGSKFLTSRVVRVEETVLNEYHHE